MTDFDTLFIGGHWTTPSTEETLEVFSPATEARVGSTPVAAPADIDAAVAAARTAFESGPWARSAPTERAQVLSRVAALIEERSAELTEVISDEMGAPHAMVGMLQQTPALAVLAYCSQLAETFPWQETRHGAFGQTRVTREPVGVVAAVIAWNVPLFLAVNKLAPALLAGCSVLLKPAPETPLGANLLADIITEAGVARPPFLESLDLAVRSARN